ncbi:hypothetical protein OPS25_12255 [Alteromonas ponticola]|uniref:MvdD-like pre-ATP grasp domain-containing protein n=1 Tax=Alteromonas aquimaris TaxID=2998417 RepID=A0ABT3P915_9ALTE|nr:hypothetical protein [Alteromonas aquimaris]MCW8109272.1 hypothetical protein [Alteromonas aquimaris]
MSLIIFGRSDDPQVSHIERTLAALGHQTFIFDGGDFPATHSMHFDVTNNHTTLYVNDKPIILADISAVYWHRFHLPEPTKVTRTQREFARQNCLSTLNVLFHATPIRWVNGMSSIRYHQSKPLQLVHAKRLGANVAETIITNVVHAAEKFVSAYSRIIAKPVYGGELAQHLWANKLPEDYWDQFKASGPITLQRYIQGTNIRTYVCGQQCVSAELSSDHIDYRTDDETAAIPHSLPQAIIRLSLLLCKDMGMVWCAIDWRLEDGGTYWFLEINPAPYFLRFEQETGLGITRMLVNELTAYH